MSRVQRPARFAGSRYLGDKRNQRVYDLDRLGDDLEAAVADLMASEQFTAFAPDTLSEARNRGYHPAPDRTEGSADA